MAGNRKGLARGIWCGGEATDGRAVLIAVDSRGLWRDVLFVPIAIEAETRERMRTLLDTVDPAPRLTLVRGAAAHTGHMRRRRPPLRLER